MKKIFIIFLAVILLFTITACGAKDSPSGVVSDCYDALISGNAETFLSCFTPDIQEGLPELLAFLTGETVEDYLKWGLEDDPIVKYVITQEESDGQDHATVSVDITYESQKVRSRSMDCVKIKGKWYIDFDFMFENPF